MAEELIVCNATSMDWLSIAAEEIQNPSSDTQVYHSVDELLEGVEQMEKESAVCQQSIVPTEIPNPVSVEVEVHQPPKSIVESSKRGRGRGVRGRGGRGGRGRGSGRGVKRLPSVSATAATATISGEKRKKRSVSEKSSVQTETIDSITRVSEVSEIDTSLDHTIQDEDDDVQLVDQMLEHGLNKTANSDQDHKKKTIVEQLKIQFVFTQSNVLNLTHAVNHLAFSSVMTEKNQKYLVGMKNSLQKLTGKISDCFDQQIECVEQIEELLTSSIYKVNPTVLHKSFDPNVENLTSRVIENAMKRKREGEMMDLCHSSRENFRKYLKPTILRNGKNWKTDGAKIFNPTQFYEVWESLYETYSLIVRDEELYSLLNFPFFENYKDFEDWLRKKKEEDKVFYDAVLKVLAKLAKGRHQAYDDYVNKKITDDVCEDLLKIKKSNILSVLPAVLKR